MKKSIFLSVILLVSAFTINAQNDTMYIMKNGVIVGQYIVNTEVDSMTFYRPTIASAGTFTDSRDNTVYNWVKIGHQVWMSENLRYLPSVVGQDVGSETTPYYYVYDYDGTVVAEAKATENYTTYGVLYNWPAAMNGASGSTANPSGVQGICPYGWHLPSKAEWTELTDYLGGENLAGGKLKATTLWNSPNTGATNETGFSALPGGFRTDYFIFNGVGISGYWWSATESIYNYSWFLSMAYNNSNVFINYLDRENGYSVRCVRN